MISLESFSFDEIEFDQIINLCSKMQDKKFELHASKHELKPENISEIKRRFPNHLINLNGY